MSKILTTTIMLVTCMLSMLLSVEAKTDVVTIESKDGSFLVDFPAKVSDEEFSHPSEPGIGFRYFAFVDGKSFYAFSYPKTAAPAEVDVNNASPWFVETEVQTTKVFNEYRVKAETIQFSSQKVTFAQIIERPDDPESRVHQIMNLTVGDRLLSFRVVSKLGDDPEAGERFFESVRIGAGKISVLPPGKSPRSTREVVTKSNAENGTGSGVGTGSGTGEGSGAGSGSGNGSGSGTKDTSPISTENRDLKIISIDKAQFTTLASYYRISGDVLLRVTFGSDGTIGSVSPVKGLAFGLTESAVQAALKIAFSPKIVNGKPVASTKVVKYNFRF